MADGFHRHPGFTQSGLTQETKRIRFALTTPPRFRPIWVAKDLGLFSYYRESDAAVTDKVAVLMRNFQARSQCARRRHRNRRPGFASRRPLQKDLLKTSLYKDDAPLERIIKEGWLNQLQRSRLKID